MFSTIRYFSCQPFCVYQISFIILRQLNQYVLQNTGFENNSIYCWIQNTGTKKRVYWSCVATSCESEKSLISFAHFVRGSCSQSVQYSTLTTRKPCFHSDATVLGRFYTEGVTNMTTWSEVYYIRCDTKNIAEILEFVMWCDEKYLLRILCWNDQVYCSIAANTLFSCCQCICCPYFVLVFFS